ncbi:MAG TPA: heavy-metal-associated domain-containing protein, partial [Geobacteraceae bacterium]
VALLCAFAFSVKIRSTADAVAVLGTTGITCGDCSNAIEKALQARRGVASVEVDVQGRRVTVGYDSKETRPEDLMVALTGVGHLSRIEKVLTVEQYRSLTGRYPGGETKGTGCGCGAWAR